ncbi:MAG: hypothetical protein ACOX3T_06780 [Bdellovibrionota bacterium]
MFDKIKETNADMLFMAVKDKNSKEVGEALSYIKESGTFDKDIYLFEYSTVNKILNTIDEIGEIIGRKI